MDSHDFVIAEYLCRICLSKDSVDVVSLFDDNVLPNLSQKIMFCTNLKLFPIPGLPNEICKLCCDVLTIADNFRSKCRKSDNFLRKLYPERFIHEDKLHTKEFGDDIESQNEISYVQDDENSTNKITTNLELIPSQQTISNKNTDNNASNYDVYIKEEKSESFGSVDFFNDDFSYERDEETRQVSQQKKSEKKKKLNKKNNKVHEERRFDTLDNVDITVKEEIYENKDGLSDIILCNDVASGSKLKMYICAECGKPLSNKISLRRHIQNMHSDEKKVLAATNSRKTGHGKDKRFHCLSCPYVTKFSQSLIYHERIHTGERPHKCPHCNRSFSQPGSLSCHLKTHSDKTYFTCAACGKQFKHKDSYEVHKRIHSEDRELFTCDICNASLKSRKTLESHMNRHNNIKNYSCETCGLRFVTLVELINHSKKHNTEKIYKCNFCDFRTAMKRSLQSHTKRHSNHRPFKCQSCDLSCFTKWELRNHEKTHTRESNYTCFICQRKFIHNSSVSKHMQRTHGVKYQRNEDVDRRKVKRVEC